MGCIRSESRSCANAAAGASKVPMSTQAVASWVFITLSFHFHENRHAAMPFSAPRANAKQGRLASSAGSERLAQDAVGPIQYAPACPRNASLHLHVVLDGFHALDAARQFERSIRLCLRTDEAAQLHFAVVGGDLDIQNLRQGILKDRCLHLGRDDRVVEILARALLAARRCATAYGNEGDGQKCRGEDLAEPFHSDTPRIDWE